MTCDPFDQLLRDLTLERHNGGGWRPSTSKSHPIGAQRVEPDPDAERHRQVLADYVLEPVDNGLGERGQACHLRPVGNELIKRSA